MIIVFDTETTGLPLFREPSNDPGQPHIVQLAALLIDPDTREEIDSCDLIVRPDGWTVPEEVAAIHGITHERAMDEGVAESYVTERLMEMADRAMLRIAHNVTFDDRIARIAMMRLGIARDAIEAREGRPKFCTMNAASKIMKMAPTAKMAASGFTRPKPPQVVGGSSALLRGGNDGGAQCALRYQGLRQALFSSPWPAGAGMTPGPTVRVAELEAEIIALRAALPPHGLYEGDGYRFYTVWRRDGGTMPRYRHPTYGLALREAQRLSRAFPLSKFYVLSAEAQVVAGEVAAQYPRHAAVPE